jgi:hypothetical protein
MKKHISIVSDVAGPVKVDSDLSEVVHHVVFEVDIFGVLDLHSESVTVVNGRVFYTAVALVRVLKPEGSFEGIDLGAVVNFYAVQLQVPYSLDHLSLSVELYSVSSHDLTSPGLDVLSDDPDVPCEKDDFTSDVNSVLAHGGLCLTPMVEDYWH